MTSKKRYKVDAMDLEYRHVAILKRWIAWLEDEHKLGGGGITVPIKGLACHHDEFISKPMKRESEMGDWFEEWVPSDNWDKDKE